MVSRIAKKPIIIPSGVEANISDKIIVVKGKLGELTHAIPQGVKAAFEDKSLKFQAADEGAVTKKIDQLIGTTHALTKNMVHGVSEGFSRTLLLVGVGYRAELKGNKLNLIVGYSHPVEKVVPKGLTVKIEKPTTIVVSGINKQEVSQFAAKIRAVRPPEPYKGKGIRYEGELIKKKEVKKK
jgi:large subunit ribosomal protein L6